MKFSENWLRELVNPDLSTAVLCHQLTMAGLEVDAVEPVAPEHSGVVIGEIIAANKHPDADKLQVCLVNVGDLSSEPLQIVCGAANARVGIKVACAMIKAILPGNFKIKKSKLRGVESFGMLCSAKELGLSDDSDGIMELADEANLGMTLVDYFQLNDQSIELGITPNRSDCLSLEGIARETAVITSTQITPLSIDEVNHTIDDVMSVSVSAPTECPVYSSRIIKNINSKAITPLWMQERLRRSGIRSISLMVDITNYVMLEIGQPMHAFDYDELDGGITVRMASEGEQLELLDHQTITLKSSNLIIADAKGPLALAGIMGGLRGSVTDNTQNIVLESAFFTPELIAGKAREFGLHTDSSHRFERGVSPALQERAIHRATALINANADGDVGPVVKFEDNNSLPNHIGDHAAITFNPTSIKKVLGVSLDDTEIEKMFLALEMDVDKGNETWQVSPPAFRFDINYEVDLVEEVARLYGYDNLPISQLHAPIKMQARPEEQLNEQALKDALVSMDYQEVINYSFVDPKIQEILQPDSQKIDLTNPISADLSQMRSSLWQGLIKSLVYNQNRQQSRIRLFESGSCFYNENDEIKQINRLAGICTGNLFPEQWGIVENGLDKKNVDFFDLKSDVENILSIGSNLDEYQFVAEKHPALHPGQTARIYKGNIPLGWMGTIHPELTKKLQVKQEVFLFELDLDALLLANIPAFKVLSKYPAIRRDIALIVDKSCVSGDMIKTIRDSGGNQVVDVLLFDTYTSDNIAADKKSLAIGITVQDENKTLVDEDVDGIVQKILSKLETDFGAKLRD